MSYVPWNTWENTWANISRASIPESPGPPKTMWHQRYATKRRGVEGVITWVKEDGTLLLYSCGILHYGEACISSRAIMVIHRNLEISTLEVGICGIDFEDLAGSPRNLGVVQEGW